MKELENRIRASLPRLNELTKGCIVRKEGCLLEVIDDKKSLLLCSVLDLDYAVLWHEPANKRDFEILGHPIRLNDVLEWLCKSKNYSCNMQDGNFYIFGNAWNLSSIYLADQSKDLINYLTFNI